MSLPPAGRISLRSGFLRVTLNWSVVVVIALFPCGLPSFELLELSEFEAPLDPDEPAEDAALSTPARSRVRCCLRATAWRSARQTRRDITPLSPRFGGGGAQQLRQRIPVGRLAPMRC